MQDNNERWPVAKDIAIAVGVGFLLAVSTIAYSWAPFWTVWVACTAAAFFGITIYHTVGPLSPVGAFFALCGCGAVAGSTFSLISGGQTSAWVGAAEGAALVAAALIADFALAKLYRRIS